MKDKYCPICFKNLEEEQHQDYCPKKPKNMSKEIEELFGNINKPPKKD